MRQQQAQISKDCLIGFYKKITKWNNAPIVNPFDKTVE